MAGRRGRRGRIRSRPARPSWPMPWPSCLSRCPIWCGRPSTTSSRCGCPRSATDRSPSRETGREPPAGKAALAAWRIPALVFDPPAAAELLAALDGPAESHQDMVTGPSLVYLTVVARFAADLVTRGRVLPALVAEDEGWAARWRPVLAAADTQRARELAAAMPPLCRAAGGDRPRRPARCSRARSTPSPMPRRAPACKHRSCPPAEAAAPLVSVWQNGPSRL